MNPSGGLTTSADKYGPAHRIPLGALVEMPSGVRLWVARHVLGYDLAPLYCLCHDRREVGRNPAEEFYNFRWVNGVSEDKLRVIQLPEEKVELKPCPFCGFTLVHFQNDGREGLEEDAKVRVICPACGAMTFLSDEKSVAARWNKRVGE